MVNGMINALSNPKYRYIVSGSDLLQSFYENNEDLIYTLKKETARQRYILTNTKGIQQQIEDLVYKAVNEISQEAVYNICAECLNDIISGFNRTGKISFNMGGFKSKTKNSGVLSKTAAKMITQGAAKIAENAFNVSEDSRRRK